ncbi:50S ribosomal protein L1 [Methanopyrus kandleri]
MAITEEDLIEPLRKVVEYSPPRRFLETVDMIVNVKGVDLSDPSQRIDKEVVLPHGRGKPVNVCVIAEGEMAREAEEAGATVINREKLEELAENVREAKKIARRHEFFYAQVDLMPDVGRVLGPVLGPRGKMAKPVPPNADIRALIERAHRTARVRMRDQPVIHTVIGARNMEPEQLAENAMAVLREITSELEKSWAQIDSVYVKTTMGPAERVY